MPDFNRDREKLVAELDALQSLTSSRASGALVRWCIRWALTIALFLYFGPTYPILWWVLGLTIPFGLYSLFQIIRLGPGVSRKTAAIRSRLLDNESFEA